VSTLPQLLPAAVSHSNEVSQWNRSLPPTQPRSPSRGFCDLSLTLAAYADEEVTIRFALAMDAGATYSACTNLLNKQQVELL
jgi:hypothetical protein